MTDVWQTEMDINSPYLLTTFTSNELFIRDLTPCTLYFGQFSSSDYPYFDILPRELPLTIEIDLDTAQPCEPGYLLDSQTNHCVYVSVF